MREGYLLRFLWLYSAMIQDGGRLSTYYVYMPAQCYDTRWGKIIYMLWLHASTVLWYKMGEGYLHIMVTCLHIAMIQDEGNLSIYYVYMPAQRYDTRWGKIIYMLWLHTSTVLWYKMGEGYLHVMFTCMYSAMIQDGGRLSTYYGFMPAQCYDTRWGKLIYILCLHACTVLWYKMREGYLHRFVFLHSAMIEYGQRLSKYIFVSMQYCTDTRHTSLSIHNQVLYGRSLW